MNPAADYVIVGAGAAGCVLAHRLTEDPACEVLLLEAGGWDNDPLIYIPLGFGKLVDSMRYDWGYVSEPEQPVGGRRLECARGRVVGGSSSINAMAYVRGHRADYDRWAASGLRDWSYRHVLPYFRRQETWEEGGNAYRGASGPLQIQRTHLRDPVRSAFAEAGAAASFAVTSDYNGAEQEGFCDIQNMIGKGRRSSGATAYLRPVLYRPNLQIKTNALATSILMEGSRATGVAYQRRGQRYEAHARCEVLIAAGAINSPHLLMLSGIGSPDESRAIGIETKVPLPGVGQNFQDHLVVNLAYRRREPGPFHHLMRYDRVAREMARAYLFGTGMATELPVGGMAFVKGRPDATIPDLQLILAAAPGFAARPYLWPFRAAFEDGFVARAVMLRPESRGRLSLASADPSSPPRLFNHVLTRDADWKTMRSGIRVARNVMRQAPMQGFIDAEVAPVPRSDNDADLDAHIRATATTFRHPLGTCRMGPAADRMAVVDPELRVHGAEALRVVDASAMPDLVGGNINAAVVMIAEKAADMIRARPAPPPDAI